MVQVYGERRQPGDGWRHSVHLIDIAGASWHRTQPLVTAAVDGCSSPPIDWNLVISGSRVMARTHRWRSKSRSFPRDATGRWR